MLERSSRYDDKLRNILGLDPGINSSSGFAIVVVHSDSLAPRLIDVIDIPASGAGAKECAGLHAVRTWIEQHARQRALIARAQAMPKHAAHVLLARKRDPGRPEAALIALYGFSNSRGVAAPTGAEPG
jgi:hypothetical protein